MKNVRCQEKKLPTLSCLWFSQASVRYNYHTIECNAQPTRNSLQRSTNQTQSKQSKKEQTHRSWCEHQTTKLADPLRVHIEEGVRHQTVTPPRPVPHPADDGHARRPRGDEILFNQDAIHSLRRWIQSQV